MENCYHAGAAENQSQAIVPFQFVHSTICNHPLYEIMKSFSLVDNAEWGDTTRLSYLDEYRREPDIKHHPKQIYFQLGSITTHGGFCSD